MALYSVSGRNMGHTQIKKGLSEEKSTLLSPFFVIYPQVHQFY